MNAVEILITGITAVFTTLSILSILLYISGKLISKITGGEREKIAAIVTKLYMEGKL